MTLLAAALLAAACAAAFGWWGSDIVFHPPRLLPLEIVPEQFGLSCDRISFRTSDGLTLKGWAIPAAVETDRTLLVCHGWGDNKGDALRRFHFLARRHNLLMFDSRSHGESEGTVSTVGCLEALDFDAALAFFRGAYPRWTSRLGVVGLSMGAGMAIRGMAEHEAFRCAVLESPFDSFADVVRQFTWSTYRLPFFPFAWLVLLFVRLRLGRDPEPCSPGLHLPRVPARPLFFIAAGRDSWMPLPVTRRLFASAREPKELWLIPEATHGHCQETAGPQYERRIGEFLERSL